MINDGYNTFIEIAPHPVLTNGALKLLKETKTHQRKRLDEDNHPFLPENTQMISDPGQILWSLPLSDRAHPYLKDHEVDGAMVFPGKGHKKKK